jgi:hypothetical protein
MNELLISVAGYFVGLVVTAIIVAPLGVIAYLGSTLVYFLLMGVTMAISNSYTDKDNPLRTKPASMAFVAGFFCALLASASIVSAVIVGVIAMAVTSKVTA